MSPIALTHLDPHGHPELEPGVSLAPDNQSDGLHCLLKAPESSECPEVTEYFIGDLTFLKSCVGEHLYKGKPQWAA